MDDLKMLLLSLQPPSQSALVLPIDIKLAPPIKEVPLTHLKDDVHYSITRHLIY